jgi:hypothetical protein
MIGGFATVATGQGTIQFNNSVLTRVRDLDGQPMSVPFNVAVYFSTAPGLWQGPGQPIGRSLATSPGVFTAPNGSFAYQLPGTEGGQVVSLQFYAWTAAQGDDPYLAWLSGARTAITEAEQFILGSSYGPGTVVWSAADPARLQPIQFNLGPPPAPPVVPEPSVLALAMLGGGLVLVCARQRRRDPFQDRTG